MKRNSKAYLWSFVENFSTLTLNFVTGIILTRLLEPEDFGLLGVLIIFNTILTLFSDGGFGLALIQKPNCTSEEYNSVFYFNIIASLFGYSIFYLSADYIETFTKMNHLGKLLQTFCFSMVIISFGTIQNIILTKKLDFKTLYKISFISQCIAAIVAVTMALKGCSYWSLIWRTIIASISTTILLYFYSKWRPRLGFSFSPIRNMWSFGSKLFLSNIINRLFENFHILILTKTVTVQEIGLYNRSESLKNLPSSNLANVIQRVSFPILSKLQNDRENMKAYFLKLLKLTALISSFLLFVLFALSPNLVYLLYGEKWEEIIPFVQLFCLSAFLYPIHVLNLNLINALGRSDIYLKLEILKKILMVPGFIILFYSGIELLLIYYIVYNFICFYLNSYAVQGILDLSISLQLKKIWKPILFSVIIGLTMSLICSKQDYKVLNLFYQIIAGFMVGFTIRKLLIREEILLLSQKLKELIRYDEK